MYAKNRPDEQVLVIDFTEEGDLTKRLLGGVEAAREKVPELFGGIFRLLADAEKQQRTGISSWLWNRDIDLEKHAVRLTDHNFNMPGNLFLVSSGAYPKPDEEMEASHYKKLAESIRQAVEKSPKTWKLFCDTDGDRRPSPMTKVAYCLCPFAIVMVHLNKCDLERIETMLGLLHLYRETLGIDTQVACIVWNFVKLQKQESCTLQGDFELDLPFTPTKVCQDILNTCIRRICGCNEELPGLFLYGAEEEAAFVKKTILVQKELADNVLKPSEELGLPFARMLEDLVASGKKQMGFQSGDVKYEAKEEVIQGAVQSLDDLCERINALSIAEGD